MDAVLAVAVMGFALATARPPSRPCEHGRRCERHGDERRVPVPQLHRTTNAAGIDLEEGDVRYHSSPWENASRRLPDDLTWN